MDGAALNGAEYLPAAIAAHLPLDLVVMMLRSSDTKAQFQRTPFRVALGAGCLIDIVQSSGEMFGGGWYSYDAPEVQRHYRPATSTPTYPHGFGLASKQLMRVARLDQWRQATRAARRQARPG